VDLALWEDMREQQREKSYICADIKNEAGLKLQRFINANIFSLVKTAGHFEAFGIIGFQYKAKSKRSGNCEGSPDNDGSESGGNFFENFNKHSV
jgi:hypothetical protein